MSTWSFLLDIEKGRPGQPCFRYQLAKCAGSCCGTEPLSVHQSRLRAALTHTQVRHWPFPGRIAIEEKQGRRRAFHVISNWFYLGTAATLRSVQKLRLPAAGFDRDCYRILCHRLFHEENAHIRLLDAAPENPQSPDSY